MAISKIGSGGAGGKAGVANAASVAIVRGGEVLLIRRAKPPYAGLWTLPGGRAEAGESIEETARREAGEELGLRLGTLRPLIEIAATAEWRLQVFASPFAGGEIAASDEIAGWRWAGLAEAEALATTPGLVDVLRLALRGERPGA